MEQATQRDTGGAADDEEPLDLGQVVVVAAGLRRASSSRRRTDRRRRARDRSRTGDLAGRRARSGGSGTSWGKRVGPVGVEEVDVEVVAEVGHLAARGVQRVEVTETLEHTGDRHAGALRPHGRGLLVACRGAQDLGCPLGVEQPDLPVAFQHRRPARSRQRGRRSPRTSCRTRGRARRRGWGEARRPSSHRPSWRPRRGSPPPRASHARRATRRRPGSSWRRRCAPGDPPS